MKTFSQCYLALFFALPALSLSAAESPFPVKRWIPGNDEVSLRSSARFAKTDGILQVVAGENAVIPILVDLHPGIGTQSYRLVGQVRHERVGGTAFLETWTVFGENRAFSRTLAELGPMAKLSGTSAWREFILPMNMDGTSVPIDRIEFNAVLPDGGEVSLKDLRLEPITTISGTSGIPIGLLFVVTAIVMIGFAVAAFLYLGKRRRAREVELNRMMAADV